MASPTRTMWKVYLKWNMFDHPFKNPQSTKGTLDLKRMSFKIQWQPVIKE